jgi:hypothetical protein
MISGFSVKMMSVFCSNLRPPLKNWRMADGGWRIGGLADWRMADFI